MKNRISMIAAFGERNRVIGRNNELPWSTRLTPDMHRFARLTAGHTVIMGRHTWDSIPERYRPLPGRTNFVLTRNLKAEFPGAHTCFSFYGALSRADVPDADGEIFIIGGQIIYELALLKAHRLYATLVDEDPEGDSYFPDYQASGFTKIIEREVVANFLPRLTYLTLERE